MPCKARLPAIALLTTLAFGPAQAESPPDVNLVESSFTASTLTLRAEITNPGPKALCMLAFRLFPAHASPDVRGAGGTRVLGPFRSKLDGRLDTEGNDLIVIPPGSAYRHSVNWQALPMSFAKQTTVLGGTAADNAALTKSLTEEMRAGVYDIAANVMLLDCPPQAARTAGAQAKGKTFVVPGTDTDDAPDWGTLTDWNFDLGQTVPVVHPD